MLRKLFLLGVMALSLASPVAILSQARADDMALRHAHHAHYDVMYRRDHHHSWRVYGSYETRHDADHAAHHLSHHGYEVHIDIR